MTLIRHFRRSLSRSARVQSGMTLLEIMVTITIIGVVMGMVAVAVIPQLDKARADTTKSSIRNVETGLKLYYTRHGKYPDTGGGLQALVTEKALEKMPKDGWGNDFVYLNEGSSYKVISYGSDGAPGGADAAADISSDAMDKK
ncbi:MAG: type II secretion system protein GspG [Myxococcales bacterium]|jgi:general secretion pathway protein G|nr:type II secretion system protein GspG [Myxococcales bacterium]